MWKNLQEYGVLRVVSYYGVTVHVRHCTEYGVIKSVIMWLEYSVPRLRIVA